MAQIIIPQKQFVVGSFTKKEEEVLLKGTKPDVEGMIPTIKRKLITV